ncbi:MAG: hypothetical protein ACYSWU_21685 [Planctomycetota bacterium]|jgi:hypothetical protein
MTEFESIHQDDILGRVSTFDRLILKGHLQGLFPEGAFSRFLWRQGVPLKEFKKYVPKVTAEIKAHVVGLAEQAGRPYRYLEGATTKASGWSKEDEARAIAERDGIREGLVCIFGVVEPCRTFSVQWDDKAQKLGVFRKWGKCKYYYAYLIDAEFGWMHVRLQSWFPFEMQIWINGREWLARQLDKRGIGYERYENSILRIEDLDIAQRLCEKFRRRKLYRVLNHFANWMNPWLSKIRRLGYGSYYWVADEAEYATDIMFRDRERLARLLPDLQQHAQLYFSAEDVMRFLGRKLHGNFKGELVTDRKRRPEGVRVKHRMKRNSIKFYDKWSVLRVETTINNPREFKVLRLQETPAGRKRRWVPMGKGVWNLWRYAQVAEQANLRYLEALAQVEAKGESVLKLDELCRSKTVNGKRFAKFNPVARSDAELFQAVMAGDHSINGFRNRDLALRLNPDLLDEPQEVRKRVCARISRVISKLRGHGLVSKVKDSRLYRVTKKGHRAMGAALRFRGIDFPEAYHQAH